MTANPTPLPPEGVTQALPYPPVVAAVGDVSRIAVHKWRGDDHITISMYLGDHKWVEAPFTEKDCETIIALLRDRIAATSAAEGELPDNTYTPYGKRSARNLAGLLGIAETEPTTVTVINAAYSEIARLREAERGESKSMKLSKSAWLASYLYRATH